MYEPIGSSCHAKVVPHWADFKKRMNSIPNRADDQRIGAILTSELDLREERLTYFSGVEVTEITTIPEEMHTVDLPEGLYACFENQVLSDKHSHLIDYVYGIWRPTSLYKRSLGYDYKIFDHRYIAGDPKSVSRFYVPKVEKD